MIDNIAVEFIRTKHINSFQKLYVLLFLYQHPKLIGTSQELAKKLNFGPVPLLEQILDDLREVGLVNNIASRYNLCNVSQAEASLQSLIEALKNPQDRQGILEQISQKRHNLCD